MVSAIANLEILDCVDETWQNLLNVHSPRCKATLVELTYVLTNCTHIAGIEIAKLLSSFADEKVIVK